MLGFQYFLFITFNNRYWNLLMKQFKSQIENHEAIVYMQKSYLTKGLKMKCPLVLGNIKKQPINIKNNI